VVFNIGPYTVLPDNSILITANMQSERGFPSSHQLKSYVASKSCLKLAARAVLSADAGLLVVTVNKWTTPDDSLAGVQSPVRACCDRAASQVVQLVDYAAVDRRRNFEEEIAISERPDIFDGTHCAAYCVVQNEWRKF